MDLDSAEGLCTLTELTPSDTQCTDSAAESVVAFRRQTIPFKASADSTPEISTVAGSAEEGEANVLWQVSLQTHLPPNF